MTKYATKAAFTRAVEMCKEHGIQIGAFELFADGRIRIMTPTMVEAESKPDDLFEQMEREGRI